MIIARILMGVGLLAIAAFCVFGGLASFEPTADGGIHTVALGVYSALGILALAGAVTLFRSAGKGG